VEYTDYDTRLAAYAVVTDDAGRVLLALWNGTEPGTWTLPGGGVELDESVEQGVVRELVEETGYDVALDGLLGVRSHVLPAARRWAPTDRPMKAVQVVFRARVVGGALAAEQDGTTDEARWFEPRSVAELRRSALVDAGLGMAGLVTPR
jgi:8-oxo-dGTP diphosphatase